MTGNNIEAMSTFNEGNIKWFEIEKKKKKKRIFSPIKNIFPRSAIVFPTFTDEGKNRDKNISNAQRLSHIMSFQF